MMRQIASWGWRKIYAPPKEQRKRKNIVTVMGLKLVNKDLDLDSRFLRELGKKDVQQT